MKKLIEQILLKEFSNNGITLTSLNLSKSKQDNFDYQSGFLFQLNENEKLKVINLLNEYVNKNEFLENYSITGKNFLNFKINLNKLIKNNNKLNCLNYIHPTDKLNCNTNIHTMDELNCLKDNFNNNNFNNKKTVLIDYCGVNVAKQMHIGHIRSMFIGDYIVNINKKLGNNVIIQNHIGDWGNQFGFLLEYIIENNLKIETNKQITEIYKKSYEKYNSDKTFFENSNSRLLKLFNKEELTYSLWNKIVSISLKEADNFFKLFKLNISLKDTCGESFYFQKEQDDQYITNIIDNLLKQNIAKQEIDGTILVEFEETKKLPPLILKKSNGSFLYATYDLAAIKYRSEKFNPDEIIYVVDKRQELHFKQVFEIAKNAQLTNSSLIHVKFGTILGNDKKPIKTRSGQSLYLDDLVKEGIEYYQKTSFYEDIVKNNLQKHLIDYKTVIGALKYYDLHLSPEQDYVFNWDFVLNTKGQSAPYFQNIVVRIDSIFFKQNISQENIENYLFNSFSQKYINNKDYRNIILICYELIEDINSNNFILNSNKLIDKLNILASYFHSFYEKYKIIDIKDKQDYIENINLLKLIYFCITQSLDLLGIEYYDCLPKLLNKKSDNEKEKDKYIYPKNILNRNY